MCVDYRDHEPAREDGHERLKFGVSEQDRALRLALEEVVRQHRDRATRGVLSGLPSNESARANRFHRSEEREGKEGKSGP